MAAQILASQTIHQEELREVLGLRRELELLQVRLELMEQGIRIALQGGETVEPGALRVLLEDRWNPAWAKMESHVSVYSVLPPDKPGDTWSVWEEPAPSQILRERTRRWRAFKDALPMYLLIGALVAWAVWTAVMLGLAGR